MEHRAGETTGTYRRPIWVLLACATFACAGCDDGPAASPPDPMELQGTWQGMRLSEVGSPTGRSVGVPADVSGVVVAEVSQAGGSAAFWAGIQPGDVIVSVDGNDVANLTDLYAFTAGLGEAAPIPVQLLRGGQPVSATLTPAPGATPAGQASQLFCPTDQLYWTEAQVTPTFRCPRCGGPLTR